MAGGRATAKTQVAVDFLGLFFSTENFQPIKKEKK
jgi:hypothetical protein